MGGCSGDDVSDRHIRFVRSKILRAVFRRGSDSELLVLLHLTPEIVTGDSITVEAAGDTLTHVEVAVDDCKVDRHVLDRAGRVLMYGGIVVASVIGEDKRLLRGHYIVFLSVLVDCGAGLRLMRKLYHIRPGFHVPERNF